MKNEKKRKEILDKLFEKFGEQCSICGRPLSINTASIDHVFPRQFGGSDNIDNLQPVCRSCSKIITYPAKSDFREYICQMLTKYDHFQNVECNVVRTAADGVKYLFDISFTKDAHGTIKQYFVEAKMLHTVTDATITQLIFEFNNYRKNFPDSDFILALPINIIPEYKDIFFRLGITLWDGDTLRRGLPERIAPYGAAPDKYDMLIDRLKSCPPGRPAWPEYQKLVGEILSEVLCPPLDPMSEENTDYNRANRRDFIFPNYAEHGYWKLLREFYKAEFITVDAKNLSDKIGKDDIIQVAHYLKRKGVGLFGIIVTRVGADDTAYNHLKDIWTSEDKMIVILNDHNIVQMLLKKKNGQDPCTEIIKLIEEFRKSI